jgi:hypothetical protein
MLPAYREYRPPPGLAPAVACVWEQVPATDHTQRVVPDGCVDLIWRPERGVEIAGADTGPRTEELPAGTRHSGIRIRPGAASSFLGLPASEVRDLQVSAAQVWGKWIESVDEAMACADPAHMTDEVRRLTGTTPVRFLEDARLTAA